MQIAVFVGSHDGVPVREGKGGDRLLAGLQRLPLAAFLRFQQDPLDVVRVQHGFCDNAHAGIHDGHLYSVSRCDRLARAAAAEGEGRRGADGVLN